ncbi:hypothetical protein QBC46DRAFT_303524 [Diplogelasinospora grovesii]|uniref:Protein YAE1 n=1 Tax=Diplogelasinospora grovesii TaxID=303347 RepID=A0AAN6S8Z0_9PEZI|nr:hypothetical protein QBC46DRAFT_303524 [Diplogelasinospora grovesii]
MLLRQISSQEDMFQQMTSGQTPNDNNDSPSPPPPLSPMINPLDGPEEDNYEIWGGPNDVVVSNIERLRETHMNSGYREGITAGKAESVQAGFDEGFGLGATIGEQAGQLLGFLEGLVAGLQSHGSSAQQEQERLKKLVGDAQKELSVQSIFGQEHFNNDGTWKYDEQQPGTAQQNLEQQMDTVQQAQGAEKRQNQEEGEEEILFTDVAASHPLLVKWDAVMRAETERYGVRWDILLSGREEREGDDDGGDKKKEKEVKTHAAQLPAREATGALAW